MADEIHIMSSAILIALNFYRVDAMELFHILSGALIYLVNVAPISQRVLGENPNSEQYIDRHINTLVCLLQGTPSITANR